MNNLLSPELSISWSWFNVLAHERNLHVRLLFPLNESTSSSNLRRVCFALPYFSFSWSIENFCIWIDSLILATRDQFMWEQNYHLKQIRKLLVFSTSLNFSGALPAWIPCELSPMQNPVSWKLRHILVLAWDRGKWSLKDRSLTNSDLLFWNFASACARKFSRRSVSSNEVQQTEKRAGGAPFAEI